MAPRILETDNRPKDYLAKTEKSGDDGPAKGSTLLPSFSGAYKDNEPSKAMGRGANAAKPHIDLADEMYHDPKNSVCFLGGSQPDKEKRTGKLTWFRGNSRAENTSTGKGFSLFSNDGPVGRQFKHGLRTVLLGGRSTIDVVQRMVLSVAQPRRSAVPSARTA
jgi:hypothetical protein